MTETGRDLLRVINDYAYVLATLDRYDHGTLAIDGTTGQVLHVTLPLRVDQYREQSL